MKKYFIPTDDNGKNLWLSNFSAKLNTYATKYGITPTEVTDMINSSTWFSYWLDYQNKYNEYVLKLTSFKKQVRDGVAAGGTQAIVPTPPVAGTPPTAVLPGVFPRAAKIAARIKAFQSYSETDGQDLGIVGDENKIDLNTVKPTISVRLIAGGKPEVVWNKQGLSGIEIYAAHDGVNYSFLAYDSTPNYTDNTPMPPVGQSQLWKYKAIYKLKDEPVGQWSDEVSITVTGQV